MSWSNAIRLTRSRRVKTKNSTISAGWEARCRCWSRARDRFLNLVGEFLILHAVRDDAVDCLAIVPSPSQLIFQLDTFYTGERARVRGKKGHGKRWLWKNLSQHRVKYSNESRPGRTYLESCRWRLRILPPAAAIRRSAVRNRPCDSDITWDKSCVGTSFQTD